MRKHGLMGLAWCMIVRECKHCRSARIAASKARLQQMVNEARAEHEARRWLA